MKRPCEESSSAESDVEESIDVGRESVYPGHMTSSFPGCGSPTTATPTQVMARKKRRGIIEKRRRDRINNSLSELRRLVPTAFEKQGSAKLEKAEILQMTVDHLKVLQASGGKGYLDAHALALDFLSLGFRECMTEVSRYERREGLDSGDPLRSRLLSHLSSCVSQREAATLTMTSSHPHLQQPPHPFPHPFHHHHHWAAAVATAAAFRPAAAAPYGLSGLSVSPDAGGGGAPLSQRCVASYADSTSSSPSLLVLMLPCAPAPLSASLLSLSASFPIALHSAFPLLPACSFTSSATASPPISSSSSSSSSSSHTPLSSGKPYRPWGTEVGAF
ncbi:LOW QUALITY PROTEIN: hairy/enhancer-of-split related with YRPW motif protein 2 [Labrus bergylta]|uniref:LOW QUALITY PROTEIN: hairy/enhancer-of-split related with YRPW motif protein 2 n=1 Tax=Labrus bergylta TaxID=56723 RepID=UPI00331446D0